MKPKITVALIGLTLLGTACDRGADCRVFVLNSTGQAITLSSPEAGRVDVPVGNRVLLRPTADIDEIATTDRTFIYPETVVDANVCLRSAEYKVLFLEVVENGSIQLLPKTPVVGTDFPVAPSSVNPR